MRAVLHERPAGTTVTARGWDEAAAAGRVRDRIATLAADGRVLVLDASDEPLLDALPPGASHFPQGDDGGRGCYPADGAAAIAHIEELRSDGAAWLLVPATSFWWLDRYPAFHRHVVQSYETALAPEDGCLVLRLSTDGRRAGSSGDRAEPPVMGEPGLVSVVIPCHNQSAFVAEAIESVLAQQYPRFEIVFVDDGSADNPYETVVKRYEGAVRSVWQPNQGLSAARNRGLEETRGAFVVFLDADDRLLPNALARGAQLLYSRPDAAVAAGHYRVIDHAGALKQQWAFDELGDDAFASLLQKNCIGMHATVMYRRGVFEAVGGFDPGLAACEDYDLYLRIAKDFRIERHDEVVAEYRDHANNMSKDAERMLRTVLKVLHSQQAVVEGDPHREAALRAGVARYSRQYGQSIAEAAARDLAEAGLELGADRIWTGGERLTARLRLAIGEAGQSIRSGLAGAGHDLREMAAALRETRAGLKEREARGLSEGLHGLRLLARHHPGGYVETCRRVPAEVRRRRRPGALDAARRDTCKPGFAAAGDQNYVSVVISSYNQTRFLRDALDSVVAQEYPKVQIVFVNDGSTDRPYEQVVKDFPQVRAVWQENKGPAAARNRGLREAWGGYVVFLDAADRLLPDALDVGLDRLREHPEAAFVSGHYRRIDAAGAVSYEPQAKSPGDDRYKELLRRNYVAMHGTVMYRRGALEAVGGFDERLEACEDWDLYLRLARRFPVCCHQEVVAECRCHDGNTSRDPGRMLLSVLEVLGAQGGVVKGHDDLEAALAAGIRGHCDSYGLEGIASLGDRMSRALDALRRHDPASHREVCARRRGAATRVQPAAAAMEGGGR